VIGSVIEGRLRSSLQEWSDSLDSAYPIRSRFAGAPPAGLDLGIEPTPESSGMIGESDGSAHGDKPRFDTKLLTLIACIAVLIGVAVGFGVQDQLASHHPALVTRTGETSGTIPNPTVVQTAVSRLPGVTRSAIKTTTYADIPLQGLHGTLYEDGKPLTRNDLVDVVAMAGSLRPPGADKSYNWVVEFIDPSTGKTLATTASSEGTWPGYFDGLPAHE